MMRFRAALAAWLPVAVLLAAPGALRAQATAAAGNALQPIPAVLDFKNKETYSGGVVLDYGSHPPIATQAGRIAFDDGKHHKRGFVAFASGAGTFTLPDGSTLYDANFVEGVANGWGKLTLPDGTVFAGMFANGAPSYGRIRYPHGAATYLGFLDGGCFAGALASPPAVASPPPPGTPLGGEIDASVVNLPVADARGGGTYASGPVAIDALWTHGAACAGTRAVDARITYANGDAYFGDAGFGALLARVPSGAGYELLCAHRTAEGAYDTGNVTIVSPHPPPSAIAGFAAPGALCAAPAPPGATLVTVRIPHPEPDLTGRADIAFPSGDFASANVVAGAVAGRERYSFTALSATLTGDVNAGRWTGARLTDACGNVYVATVDGTNVRAVATLPEGRRYFLFHAAGAGEAPRCDSFTTTAGTVTPSGLPDGPGIERLVAYRPGAPPRDDGTVAGTWSGGRLVGTAVLTVLRPRATIVVHDVSERGGRIFGMADVRFPNGDTAHGALAGRGDLEGPGTYRFAATGCVETGTFSHGKLHGAAALRCPDDPQIFYGTIAPDGTVQ
jgi:hypothetical protein